MSLLQTVTSLLLLHFSRLLIVSSRGSSRLFYKKMEGISLPAVYNRILQTCIFTVTTVTNKNKTVPKTATALKSSIVTVNQKTSRAVTILLQTVTNCNNNCNKLCNKIILCFSISYKICYSYHPEKRGFRIFSHQIKNQH